MKKLFFLILFINVYLNPFAQNANENMFKYWNYRNRLKYFVIPGTKQGEGQIIVKRNDMYNDLPPFLKCSNGDQTISFGFYLGMLATEYKLLSDNGQNNEATNTLHELDLALEQFINYIDKSEGYWPGFSDIEDGFFVRDNMPCDFLNTDSANGYSTNGERHLDLFNKNLTTYNVWDDTNKTFRGLFRGHPGYSDFINAQMCDGQANTKEPMSQDMAIGLLKGLALIKKYCPTNSWAYSKSKEIACNLISYIQYCPYWVVGNQAAYWQVYQPFLYNLYIEYQDQSPIFNSFGFVQASKYFDNNCVYDDPFSLNQSVWDFQAMVPADKIYNNSMRATLAAIGKSWHIGITIYLGCCWNWCSWLPCVQIPFYINVTGWGINNVTGIYDNETFYLLYYEALRNKSTSYLSQSKVLTQINSAPCEGPYDYQYDNNSQNAGIHASGGWASTVRFHHEPWQQNGTVINPDGGTNKFDFGNFTGLDYMLLYNLYHIIYGGIKYENYNDRYLSDTVNTPQNFVAFNTITSTQVIDSTTPQIVNYKAGEQIELKPGFHAQAGSTFHAYIDNVECGENFITDTVPQLPVDTLTPEAECVTDSLPAMPCGYDTLHFNGIDGDTARYSYVWSFPGGSPSSSTIKNPSVYYPTGTYQITLQATDTTQLANTPNQQYVQLPSICFNIVKPACYDSSSISIEKRLNNNTPNPDNKTLKDNEQFNVFPNPTAGIFTVSCSAQNITFTAYIYNILTDVMFLKENITNSTQFDLSLKPKGIYFVKVVTTDGKIFTGKIVNK